MANVINFIQTNAADELISKVLSGKTLNFTRMAVGDGFSYDLNVAKGFTTLVNEVLSLDITKKETLSAKSIKITSAFKNTDAQKEFYYREVGLYAQDPDTGEEVLYAYGNRNDAAELMTPTGSNVITKQLAFVISVGDSANVTFNVNADVYALQEDMLDVQADITTLQTDLDELNRTKANQTDLEVERARIDNFTALAQGSTTGDAELIDGRIDDLGNSYTNIGTALRTRISQLSSEKVDYKIGNPKKYDGYLFHAKSQPDNPKNGTIYNDNVYKSIVTEKMPCVEGDVFYYKGKGVVNAVNYIMFNGDVIVDSTNKDYTQDIVTVTIPNGVNYIQFASTSDNGEIVFFLDSPKGVCGDSIVKNREDIKNNEKAIETNGKEIENVKTMFFETPFVFEPFYKNESVLKDGTIGTYQGWYSSEPIECVEGSKISYFACQYANPAICPISFFDTNKVFIEGVNTGRVKEDGMYGEVVVPTGAKYFVVSSFKTANKTTTATAKILPVYDLSLLNPFESLNIVCIGDSLTEGDYGSEPVGTMNVKAENYPYFLQKFLGCTVENKGKCGYTALTSWNNVVQNIDFSDKDIAVIMLGTNGGLTDTLESDTVGESFTDYANTNTGAYCKIIEYIITQNADIQILLCTCPYVDASRRSAYANSVKSANVVIPKIAEKYHLPMLDVFNELGVNDVNTNVIQPIDGLHGGYKFYSKLGTYIGSKIKAVFSFVY